MELKLDNTKSYAIALEGGGARGAYQIGAWKALREAGIKFNAVSGTSVGALNAALMCMDDYERAVRLWSDIRLRDIINMNEDDEPSFKRLINGEPESLHELFHQVSEIIKHRGLDVSPLWDWVRDIVDAERIRNSGVELFVTAVSLTDHRGLEVRLNDLSEQEMCDMLLASSYHPSFRLEKLGGKLYADGCFVDSLPDHVLVKNGYRDIIGVRLPGMGLEKPFRKPANVQMVTVQTNSDLGSVLDFDAERSKRNMTIGYYDTQRMLYGLYGHEYYIDRSMSEREAFELLLGMYGDETHSLRHSCEKILPKAARKLGVREGGYYELLVAALESKARDCGLEKMKIYTDQELITLTE